MDKFLIQGGYPLIGEVTPAGNKNAALPLLAAFILTEKPIILHNVPEIRDVRDMRLLLESLGVKVELVTNHTWRIQASQVRPADLDPDLCRRIRASILLAGPMVARAGELQLPPPGGDAIGRRRAVSAHFAKQAKKGEPIPAYDSLEEEHKIKVLTALVRQQTGAEPVVPEAPEPPDGTPRAEAKAQRQAAAVEYLAKTARAGVVAPDTELTRLAEERASAIERALLGGGELDPTRVFKVREGKVTANEGKVRFQLGLQ